MAYGPKTKRDTRVEELTNAFKANPTMGGAQALKDYYNSDEYKGDKYRLEMPDEIKYAQSYDPATMSMTPDLQKKLDAIQMDKTGLNQFRKEATRSGESAWSRMAKEGVAMDSMANRENLLRGAQGRAAEARSSMAMRGGLGVGAAERAGKNAAREGIMAQQGSYRDQNRANLDISMQDEKNRIGQLGQLPGMEVQALQPEMEKTKMWQGGRQFDIGNQVTENQQKNNFNLGMWQKKMEQWGAGNTAAAQAESGK